MRTVDVERHDHHTKNVMMEQDYSLSDGTGIYCYEGHTGPLCEVCTRTDHFFSVTNRRCTKCPSSAVLAAQFLGICFGATMVIALVYYLLKRYIPSIFSIVLSLSPQAKVKLLVSFYQVLSSLENVYGVTVSSELTNWMNIFKYLSLDFLQITGIPISCIGSTKRQLMVNALWPFVIIILGGYLLLSYWMIQQRKLHREAISDRKEANVLKQDTSNVMTLLKKRTIQWIIIILYFALPLVSQRIFDAKKCRAFQIDDDAPVPAFQSHLLMDMSIICNTQKDNNYGGILVIFWSLFTVWILLIPLAFVVLLKYIGPSVRSKSITFLADACRFLWQDYDANVWFWDIVDTYRKIFLTGAIILIDPEEGSNKLLRLVVAIVISMLYHSILLAYHPYKRLDDYNLAFLSNFLMICCFVLGVILKLCTDNDQDDDGNNTGSCNQFIGLSLDSYKASILVVVLSLGMLLVTAGFIILLAINKIMAPTVRMALSGDAPDLELPEHCNFHVFMSHVWGTGQAKTHAITRKLQLFLPGLKVWLDVDELQDISKLEESVAESAVFILYYSGGYFRSKNCRREIYAAVKLDKPIILLYEGDELVLQEMEKECLSNCDSSNDEIDSPGAALILEKLLGDTDMLHTDPRMHGPIQWLNEGSFSAAAKNRIYSGILSHLPHYKRHPDLLREQGIKVPGELGEVSLETPINLLVYDINYGCSDVVEQLKTILQNQGGSVLFTVSDARMVLQKSSQEIDSGLDDAATNTSQAENLLDPALTPPHIPDAPTFFLLYLNEHTFEGSAQDQHELTAIIQSCIDDSEISIVLVHEKDTAKGGCDFGDFFKQTPQELIKPPINLFRYIAIPLYSTEEYRTISLRQILCNMGATDVMKNRSRKISIMRWIKNSFTRASRRGGDHIN
jgi:hypothetical protein